MQDDGQKFEDLVGCLLINYLFYIRLNFNKENNDALLKIWFTC